MAYQIKILSSTYRLSAVDLTDVFGFDVSEGKPNPPAKVFRDVIYSFRHDRWFTDVETQRSTYSTDELDQTDAELIEDICEMLEAGDWEDAAEWADEVRG